MECIIICIVDADIVGASNKQTIAGYMREEYIG